MQTCPIFPKRWSSGGSSSDRAHGNKMRTGIWSTTNHAHAHNERGSLEKKSRRIGKDGKGGIEDVLWKYTRGGVEWGRRQAQGRFIRFDRRRVLCGRCTNVVDGGSPSQRLACLLVVDAHLARVLAELARRAAVCTRTRVRPIPRPRSSQLMYKRTSLRGVGCRCCTYNLSFPTAQHMKPMSVTVKVHNRD